MKIREVDIANKTIEYFKKKYKDAELFQEVQIGERGSRIVDIVLKKEDILWAIEIKLNLSLALLDQGWRNLRYFNKSSIVFATIVNTKIPSFKRPTNRARDFAYKIATDYGIGLFKIRIDRYELKDIISDPWQIQEPQLKRLPMFRDSVYLCEEHKTFAKAGNSNSKRWTPFQRTKIKLIEYVKNNNGCKLKEVLQNIDHHYASVNSGINSMRDLINRKIVKEVYCENGKIYLVD
jgi:hypothetical protein